MTAIQTTCDLFFRTVEEHADEVAQRTLDGLELTWRQTADQVNRLAGGLSAFGIGRGDTVATLLRNRPEFLQLDMATIIAGGTPMSIYPTSPATEIAHLIDDAEVRVLVTEDRFEPVVRAALAEAKQQPRLVFLGDDYGQGIEGLLEACPPDFDAADARSQVSVTDVAVMVYTSGTTGPPKGVQLTHRNLWATWRAARSLDPRLDDSRRVISYLPSAHLADRLWAYLIAIRTGCSVTYLADPKHLVAALPEVRPTSFLGVPRIWEKLRAMLTAAVPEGRSASDPDVAAELRARIGMDADCVAITGAAPVDPEVLGFFDSIGVPLLEAYGMTETSGVISTNRRVKSKPGTVGYPFDGVEVKIAEDGEILVRGEDVAMLGYRNKPEKTAETIGADGWLHTGDIGSMDSDGMITILDRKKELIITSGGKNLSPANIENAIRSATPLVGPVMAVGDRKPYITALISLDPEETRAWATRHGVQSEQLVSDPVLADEIAAAIERANATLARAAQIKRFAVVPEVWDANSGLVTPTLKLKRKAALQRYAEHIEDLYS